MPIDPCSGNAGSIQLYHPPLRNTKHNKLMFYTDRYSTVFISCMPTNIKAITGTTVAFGIALNPTRSGYKAMRMVFEKPIITPNPTPTKTERDSPTTVRQSVSQP